jgi:hypothetical protein
MEIFQIGSCYTKGSFNDYDIIKKIIKHNLYDGEFHYNWTRLQDEYYLIFNKDTLVKMVGIVSENISDYFTVENRDVGEVITFNLQGSLAQEWIDNWFKENKNISHQLKSDYYAYRKKYFGIDLNKI